MERRRLALLSVWLVGGLLLLALWPAAVQAQGGRWEWQNPLPEGNWLNGVWGSSGSDVFAVGGGGTILHYGVPVERVYLPVDIKPNSCPNPIRVNERGVLPVAILGTEDLEVACIDPASVELEGVSPLRWALEDIATPFEPYKGKADAYDCTEEEADGYVDLTFKFKTQEVLAALGEVGDGDVLVLSLTGMLTEACGGLAFEGEDVVIIRKR